MTGRKILLGAGVIFFALSLQLSVFSYLPLPYMPPDVMLLAVIGLSMGFGSGYGTILGFFAGLALDLAPPADHIIGIWALVLAIIGYLAGLVTKEVTPSMWAPFFVVLGLSILANVLFSAAAQVFSDPRVSWSATFAALPSLTLYNLILTTVIVLPLLLLSRRMDRESHY